MNWCPGMDWVDWDTGLKSQRTIKEDQRQAEIERRVSAARQEGVDESEDVKAKLRADIDKFMATLQKAAKKVGSAQARVNALEQEREELLAEISGMKEASKKRHEDRARRSKPKRKTADEENAHSENQAKEERRRQDELRKEERKKKLDADLRAKMKNKSAAIKKWADIPWTPPVASPDLVKARWSDHKSKYNTSAWRARFVEAIVFFGLDTTKENYR